MAGLVINGSVRDAGGTVARGFPVFRRGLCVTSATKSVEPDPPPAKLWFESACVRPGDVVVADRDAVALGEGRTHAGAARAAMIAETVVRVPPEELRGLIHKAFRSLGIPGGDAAAAAEVLLEANLRGIDSHGFNRRPTYMDGVRSLLGAALPEGLALGAEGRPTTDADRALEGSVLPLGGPKGSNLALATAIVCGVLADFDDEMASTYEDRDRPQNVGHVFIAIDPARLGDGGASRRLEALIDRFHSLRRADPALGSLLAAEREDRSAEERRRSGIPVPVEEPAAFAEACRRSGLAALAERARKLAAPSAGEAAR